MIFYLQKLQLYEIVLSGSSTLFEPDVYGKSNYVTMCLCV